MADEEWEHHKATIVELYIHENRTLSQLMSYMASTYGFSKTKAQYERILKTWNLRKNKMGGDKWKAIAYKTGKRKREGKDSEVYDFGIKIPSDKVQKGIYRSSSYISTMETLAGASPQTPEGIVVCTPAQFSTYFSKAPLPWMKFSEALMHLANGDPVNSLSSSSLVQAPLNTLMRNAGLSGDIRWDNVNQNVSRITNAVTNLVPVGFEGQDDETAYKLSQPQRAFSRWVKLELFLLSNNNTFGKWDRNTPRYSDHVMEVFRACGLYSLKNMKALVRAPDVTSYAVAHKFFQNALSSQDIDALALMLKAGISPNIHIKRRFGRSSLPLVAAADIGNHAISIRIFKLLLSHGADLTRSSCGEQALQNAIRQQNSELVMLVLEKGVAPVPENLHDAISKSNLTLVKLLLHAGIDPDSMAIGEAARLGEIHILQLLYQHGGNMNTLQEFYFEGHKSTTTLLGLALSGGGCSLDFATFLSAFDPTLPPQFGTLPFIPPFVVAVERQNTEVAKYLLERGLGIELMDKFGKRTLLERAAGCEDMELCEMLQARGAQANACMSGPQEKSSALLTATSKNNLALVEKLLRSGARTNDIYGEPPETVLGVAIENGNCEMIKTLYLAGAIELGQKVKRIGSTKAVMYLREVGLLPEVLKICGPQTLVEAIVGNKGSVVKLLLNMNVDRVKSYQTNNETSDRESYTPLGAAILAGNIPLAEVLVDRGAPVTDHELLLAVYQASRTGDTGMFRYFLVRFQGSVATALGAALLSKCDELLRLLLAAGVDFSGPITPPPPRPDLNSPLFDDESFNISEYGDWLDDLHGFESRSVLDVATSFGQRSTLQTLLKRHQWSPQLTGFALIKAIYQAELDIAEDLILAGADVNIEAYVHHFSHILYNLDGCVNPLLLAVERGHVKLVKTLLEGGANVNYLLQDWAWAGCSALQLAVEKPNMELIRILLCAGADVNGPPANSYGATALQIAAMEGYLEIASFLIDAGADVNAPGALKYGRTALEGAAQNGRIDMVQLLLNNGALITGDYEQQYVNAIRLAEENAQPAVIRLLQEHRQRMKQDGLIEGDL